MSSPDTRPGTAKAPAGWHADPSGRHQLRFWDGSSWTDHVSDDGRASTDPIVQAAVQGGTAPAGRPRRRGGSVLIGVALVLGLLGLVDLLIGVTARPAVFPPGTPAQVQRMPIISNPGDFGFSDGMMVYQDQPIEFDITFDEKNVDPAMLNDPQTVKPILNSIDADWAGSDAQLSFDGQPDRVVKGEPGKTDSDWGTSLPDQAEWPFKPTMVVRVPLRKSDIHQEVAVTANMHVSMPYRVGSSSFAVGGTTVSKSAKFYVITQQEADLLSQADTWTNHVGILIGGATTLILAAAFGVAGLTRRRKALQSA